MPNTWCGASNTIKLACAVELLHQVSPSPTQLCQNTSPNRNSPSAFLQEGRLRTLNREVVSIQQQPRPSLLQWRTWMLTVSIQFSHQTEHLEQFPARPRVGSATCRRLPHCGETVLLFLCRLPRRQIPHLPGLWRIHVRAIKKIRQGLHLLQHRNGEKYFSLPVMRGSALARAGRSPQRRHSCDHLLCLCLFLPFVFP